MTLTYILLFVLVAFVSTSDARTDKKLHYVGQATWYNTSVGIGACGTQSSNDDHIVALNSEQYKSGNKCHLGIMIYNRQSGASIKAVVLDECPGCKYGDLDLTPETFRAIGKLDDGRVKIEWCFI